MNRLSAYFLALTFLLVGNLYAQQIDPVIGLANDNPNTVAFTNAIIHVDPFQTIERGTMLIRKGRVVQVGTAAEWPAGTVVYDLEGKHVYPSFIDLYSNYGMPKPTESKVPEETDHQFYWNPAIKPEYRAAEQFKADAERAAVLRKMGFGVVATHRPDGIARGTSVVVSLGEGKGSELVLSSEATANYSFEKGKSKHDYPRSLMGMIALLRQLQLDRNWYAQQEGRVPTDLGLEAMNEQADLPQVFAVQNYEEALRADRLGDEFGIQYLIHGSGDAYQRLDALKETSATLIVPLNFPKAVDVSDPFIAQQVSLASLKHWELAPMNPAQVAANEIPFVLTASGVKGAKSFLKNLQRAHEHGLADSVALMSLTLEPARLLGLEDELGTLEVGKQAHFFISEQGLCQPGFQVMENWVNGKRYTIRNGDAVDIRGHYDVNMDGHLYTLEVKGSLDKPKGTMTLTGGAKVPAMVKLNDRVISLSFYSSDDPYRGQISLGGKVNYKSGLWDGRAQAPDGHWVSWSAIRTEKHQDEGSEKELQFPDSLGTVRYPLSPYGFDSMPEATDLLINNVTVWTSGPEGIIRKGEVLIRDGKIAAVGSDIPLTRETEVIEGTGKHLTAGLIDEHSHIAISRGVNEGTQAISAEVRVSDVVRSTDINIYRQLSGGVTASQLLHGSSNPIGGQSALIKLKWGEHAGNMLIQDTAGFIKCALGENVKRSNWGRRSNRYPQSRMGVEQLLYDAFFRAQAYKKRWAEYEAIPEKKRDPAMQPRRDLELEALVEILDSKRFITCHSYVQSEINMLMHVADSFDFRINTFTHILEGYKLADKMKAHGAGGSTFSDWWAYKFEVNDAIPYNAALMSEAGVVTAINSDDAEMGRRLNQEAAKSMKYGGMGQEEALKMVTINPARLLHLDHRMGSIEAGKDADLVLWTANPLSVYAKVEKTFIDGTCYYDVERDAQLRKEAALERNRLIAKMLKAVRDGAETGDHKEKKQRLYHCDTVGE